MRIRGGHGTPGKLLLHIGWRYYWIIWTTRMFKIGFEYSGPFPHMKWASFRHRWIPKMRFIVFPHPAPKEK